MTATTPTCPNRQVARAPRFPLEVFKTGDGRGYGVRCAQRLPAGAVICPYIGLVVTDV